jgi:dTDP-4-dehydrorhamnose reductase
MKILVIGEGLLGRRCLELYKTKHEVIGAYFTLPTDVDVPHFQLDITSKRDVTELFNKTKPDAVIHSAAFTNVDRGETEKETAYKVNVEGSRNVALASEKIKAKLVYISTDYVFDGKKGLYKETDPTSPLNYYGLTKLKGEEEVNSICTNYVIARTSVLYGKGRKNFATWILDELRKEKKVKIVKDQIVSPTLNTDLAIQLLTLIEEDKKGIFHTAGGERINRYDFAQKLAEVFHLNQELIQPVTSEELNWTAKRPSDSSLDTTKISRIKKPLKVEESLIKLKGELEE